MSLGSAREVKSIMPPAVVTTPHPASYGQDGNENLRNRSWSNTPLPLHGHVKFSWKIQYSIMVVHLHHYTSILKKDIAPILLLVMARHFGKISNIYVHQL